MRIMVVGNGALSRDRSSVVDGGDIVVRFNQPNGLDGFAGSRFDWWVIANSRGGLGFATRRSFLNAPWKSRPDQIWFPRDVAVHRDLRLRHPQGRLLAHSELDHGDQIIHANQLAQPVRRISRQEYERSFDRLELSLSMQAEAMIPSSGFVLTSQLLDLFPEASIELVGFSFSGVGIHPWEQEKQVLSRYALEGRVRLLS